MPSITAIIPTYNRAAYLRETIEGLGRQTRPVDEIIVWNDGSSDETVSVVKRADKNIRLFNSENGGKSRALNAAIAESRGDYIWICDDDDIALPDAAEKLAGMLDTKPVGVSAGCYRRFRDGPDGPLEQGPGYWPDLSQGSPIRHLLEDIFLFQNAMMVRRDLYDQVGPFREDLRRSIDYDMVVRLGLRAPIAVSEEAMFRQRKHDGDRGPAAARHAADQSEAVWKAVDREIFAEFRSTIPLAFYDAMFESDDAKATRRAALLQRACVYARRTDWPAALEDFEAAAGIHAEVRLSEVERQICLRAMAGKHGIDEALEPDVRRRLRRLSIRGVAGAQIGSALSRGLHWRLREAVLGGDWGTAARTGVLAAALRRRGPGGLPQGPIAERRDIPAAAFLK